MESKLGVTQLEKITGFFQDHFEIFTFVHIVQSFTPIEREGFCYL